MTPSEAPTDSEMDFENRHPAPDRNHRRRPSAAAVAAVAVVGVGIEVKKVRGKKSDAVASAALGERY